MSNSIICDRSFEFAAGIIELSEKMWHRGPAARHIATQLMRSGTSIGSNAEEAQEAHSRADFVAKMIISRKEARETTWWLRLAVRTKLVKKEEVSREQDEAEQIWRMIRSAVLTAKSSPCYKRRNGM